MADSHRRTQFSAGPNEVLRGLSEDVRRARSLVILQSPRNRAGDGRQPTLAGCQDPTDRASINPGAVHLFRATTPKQELVEVTERS
jgi:hypothetical protein